MYEEQKYDHSVGFVRETTTTWSLIDPCEQDERVEIFAEMTADGGLKISLTGFRDSERWLRPGDVLDPRCRRS